MSLDKHREAGEIVKSAKAEAAGLVEAGNRAVEVAEAVEELIRSAGGAPAFPCNISINEVAAHYTPAREDDLTFAEGDLVKIDIGAHVDGYIADSAFTVSLGGDDELVTAAGKGLQAGIDAVRAGADTSDIGASIEETIREAGCRPIVNLTGHGLERFVQHADPSVPNVGGRGGVELDEGQVIAIEPFTTRGAGRVVEGGVGEIYAQVGDARGIRSRGARKLMETVEGFNELPFAKRWLPKGGRTSLYLNRLVADGVVKNYPVLREAKGAAIAQAEDTVIVTSDGCEVITR